MDLPGFRFHPTDEELLSFYLKGKVIHSNKLNFDVIGTINLYRYDPSELPGLAKIGEREWYFFVPRDRKQASGGRPNRTTERGFWKATGSDRRIRSTSDPKRLIGLKKTLVFYEGRAPHGSKTDWVMNEYRLPDNNIPPSSPLLKEDIVLCKIYRKATSLKELEQRAAMEEEARASQGYNAYIADTISFSDEEIVRKSPMMSSTAPRESGDGKDLDEEEVLKEFEISSTSSLSATRSMNLPELQVPLGLEWMQDPFLTQLRSPWLDQWSPLANILNF